MQVQFHPFGICLVASLMLVAVASLIAVGGAVRAGQAASWLALGLVANAVAVCAGSDVGQKLVEVAFSPDRRYYSYDDGVLADPHALALDVRSIAVLLLHAVGFGLIAVGLFRSGRPAGQAA